MEDRMNIDGVVKQHYEELLGKFFEAIKGTDIEEKMPAVHIPVIGNNYGDESGKYRKIMIYGMETKWWGANYSMIELKTSSKNGTAYEFLTKDFKSGQSEIFKIFDMVKQDSFFGFIIRFLSEFYEVKPNENSIKKEIGLKEEYKHILQSFIWGNIYSLERRNMDKGKEESDKEEPENWKKIRAKSKEIFDMHLFAMTGQFDKHKEYQDQLRYMLENCSPELLLILCWDINFGAWLERNYGVTWEKDSDDRENYFCYAHIKTDKIDTHVYKCAHPRYMKQGQNINFIDVIKRIKNDFNGRH
jgi:hypothetical protein